MFKHYLKSFVQHKIHNEKMGWFAIHLATRFLSYNDYLQLIGT
jgi:hypothetical protein